MEGVNIQGLKDMLDQIEIYTSENKESIKLMKSQIESLADNKAYESLMKVKDKEEVVTFYAQKEKNKFRNLVMLVEEPTETVIIRIIGSFTKEDILKIVNPDNK